MDQKYSRAVLAAFLGLFHGNPDSSEPGIASGSYRFGSGGVRSLQGGSGPLTVKRKGKLYEMDFPEYLQ